MGVQSLGKAVNLLGASIMIWQFVKRELKALFKDPGFLLLVFGGPLFYSIFYPLPYTYDVARHIPVAVLDEDKSFYSRKLVQILGAEEELLPLAYEAVPNVKQALEKREIFGVVIIPRDFGKNIMKGITQRVPIYTDGSYPIYYKQTTAALQRAIKTMSAGVEIQKLRAYGAGKSAPLLRSPIRLNIKNLYSPSGAYRGYLVPAVFVTVTYQIILMVIGLRAGTLREWKKQYPAQFTPFLVWIGKMISFLMFMLLYFFYLFVCMFRLYGFSGGTHLGPWLAVYILFSWATVGLGLTLGSLFKERESSVMFIVVTSLPLVFISGVIWPVWKMPLLIRVLRLCVPITYGITGVVRVFVMNGSLADITPYLVGCLGLAVLFSFTSYYAIKKRFPIQI